MTGRPRLELGRRALRPLLGDSLRTYFRHFLTFTAIGLAIVMPAELIVSGVGLGRLTSGYHADQPLAAELIPQLVQLLVTTPLIAAAVMYVLLDLARGDPSRVRRSIQAGLDVFPAVFVPALAAIGCFAIVTLVVVVPLAETVQSALVPTLVIPLYLAVRWYFVPQVVVAAGARRLGALRASWELTRGRAWRVFGTVLLAYVATTWCASLVATPLLVAARAANSGALLVGFNVLWQALAIPAIAIVSTLLYFDVRARARA